MTDFIAALDEMRGRTKYDYVAEMASGAEAWIMKNMPITAAGLSIGIVSHHDGYERVFCRISMTDDYKTLGLKTATTPAQWQYKDMVKRAGAEVLESACQANGIDRSTVINAIFANDWRSLDELIRYHLLDVAVAMAVSRLAGRSVKHDA